MQVSSFEIEGPLLVEPRVFHDSRGFFFESWNQLQWQQQLQRFGQTSCPFVQDNHSCSTIGVLRGLHYQREPHAQGKLVRCAVGEIFDVAVDLRAESESFGQWVGAKLSAENSHQLWVPAGFAHGFLTLSKEAQVLYKTTDFWSRDHEGSIRWDDPDVAIAWPALPAGVPISLSDKDREAPGLADLSVGDLF